MADLSEWFGGCGLGPAALTEAVAREFGDARRRDGRNLWPPWRNRPVVPSRRLEIRTVTNPRTLPVISRPYPISSTTCIAVACRSSSAG